MDRRLAHVGVVSTKQKEGYSGVKLHILRSHVREGMIARKLERMKSRNRFDGREEGPENADSLHPSHTEVKALVDRSRSRVLRIAEKYDVRTENVSHARAIRRRLDSKEKLADVTLKDYLYKSPGRGVPCVHGFMYGLVKRIWMHLLDDVFQLPAFKRSPDFERLMKEAFHSGDWRARLAAGGMNTAIMRSFRSYFWFPHDPSCTVYKVLPFLQTYADKSVWEKASTPSGYRRLLKDEFDFTQGMIDEGMRMRQIRKLTRRQQAELEARSGIRSKRGAVEVDLQRRLNSLRILLLMAGVEPNPGPPKIDPKRSGGSWYIPQILEGKYFEAVDGLKDISYKDYSDRIYALGAAVNRIVAELDKAKKDANPDDYSYWRDFLLSRRSRMMSLRSLLRGREQEARDASKPEDDIAGMLSGLIHDNLPKRQYFEMNFCPNSLQARSWKENAAKASSHKAPEPSSQPSEPPQCAASAPARLHGVNDAQAKRAQDAEAFLKAKQSVKNTAARLANLQKRSKAVRGNKRLAAIGRSLMDTLAQERAERDAARERLYGSAEELQDKLAEASCPEFVVHADGDDGEVKVPDQGVDVSRVDPQVGDIIAVMETQEMTEDCGLTNDTRNPVGTFSFHAKYHPDMYSTFDNTSDPLVTVNIYPGGMWESDAFSRWSVLQIRTEELLVAGTTVACDDPQKRFRNIYNGLVQSKEVNELVKQMDYEDRITYLQTMEYRAFLLTGVIHGTGRIRWMNECPEWVCHKYTVNPPADWKDRLIGVYFSSNTLAFEARTARNARAAPYVVDGLIPHIPDAADRGTLIAGLCKRLFPVLNVRTTSVLQRLRALTDELFNLIRTNFMRKLADGEIVDKSDDELLEEALAGRPQKEVGPMREGWQMFMNDPQEAIRFYNACPYKCFIKLESYPDGSFKPPRFIMCLDLKARGIQVAAMARILWAIEVGTQACNVKHLTPDEITEKLKHKFENIGLVAETDFSSFESCIGPDLKNVVENYLFWNIAPANSPSQDFINDCLCRDEVYVRGPCFVIPHFHHIRMSGDLWTSLGNLVTNIVLIAFVTNDTVEHVVKTGLFEGDDGCFPAPADCNVVIERAVKAGVLLTFDVAPWMSLSFCGNHFVQVNGQVLRHRDPYKALVNNTILFNAPRETLRHDRMLQRSKQLSYLSGPIIPDCFVFNAVVERVTRDAKVDLMLMTRMGLMKEYGAYGVESCVPDYLIFHNKTLNPFKRGKPLTDEEFVRVVYRRNKVAGGLCPKSTIREMLQIARAAGPDATHVVLPNPCVNGAPGQWYARDGFRFSHKQMSWLGEKLVYNDVQNRREVEMKGAFGEAIRVRSLTKVEITRGHNVQFIPKTVYDRMVGKGMFMLLGMLTWMLFCCGIYKLIMGIRVGPPGAFASPSNFTRGFWIPPRGYLMDKPWSDSSFLLRVHTLFASGAPTGEFTSFAEVWSFLVSFLKSFWARIEEYPEMLFRMATGGDTYQASLEAWAGLIFVLLLVTRVGRWILRQSFLGSIYSILFACVGVLLVAAKDTYLVLDAHPTLSIIETFWFQLCSLTLSLSSQISYLLQSAVESPQQFVGFLQWLLIFIFAGFTLGYRIRALVLTPYAVYSVLRYGKGNWAIQRLFGNHKMWNRICYGDGSDFVGVVLLFVLAFVAGWLATCHIVRLDGVLVML